MITNSYKGRDALIDVSTSQEKSLGGNSFSAPLLLARILEGGKEPRVLAESFLGRDARPCAPTLQSAIDALTPEQEKILAEQVGDHIAEFLALSEQTSPKIFYTELYQLGRELENTNHLEIAKNIYSAIVGAGFTRPPWQTNQETILQSSVALGQVTPAPTEIEQQAQARLEIIQGGGSVGAQLNFSTQRFVQRVLEPSGMVGMGLGLGVSKFTEALVFSRLTMIANSGAPTFIPKILSTGLGKRLTAGLAAFMAEVPSFTLGGKVTRSLLGKTEDYSYQALKSELTSSALFLGGMKTFGISGGMLTRSITSPFQAAALRQASTLLGIMAGHLLEIRGGYKEVQKPAHFFVDSLVTLLDLHVMGEISNGFYGERFKAFQQNMAESVHENTRGDGGGFLQDLKAMWNNLGSRQFATANGAPISPLRTPNSDPPHIRVADHTSPKRSPLELHQVFTQSTEGETPLSTGTTSTTYFFESAFRQGKVLIESAKPKYLESEKLWRFMKGLEDGISTLLLDWTSDKSDRIKGPLADLLRTNKGLTADLVRLLEIHATRVWAKIDAETGILQQVLALDRHNRPKIILGPAKIGTQDVVRFDLSYHHPEFPSVWGSRYRFEEATQSFGVRTLLPDATYNGHILTATLTDSNLAAIEKSDILKIGFSSSSFNELVLEQVKSPPPSWQVKDHEGNVLLTFATSEIKPPIPKPPKGPKLDPKTSKPASDKPTKDLKATEVARQTKRLIEALGAFATSKIETSKPTPEPSKPPSLTKTEHRALQAEQKLRSMIETFDQLSPNYLRFLPERIVSSSPKAQLEFVRKVADHLAHERPQLRVAAFDVLKVIIPYLSGPTLLTLRNYLNVQYPQPRTQLSMVEQVLRYIRDEFKKSGGGWGPHSI